MTTDNSVYNIDTDMRDADTLVGDSHNFAELRSHGLKPDDNPRMQAGPGARLPSVRALIRTCGVSQSVVVQALDRLEIEGCIERRARSGLFVSFDYQRRPRLVICEPNMFISSSPWGELLLDAVIRPYANRPDDAQIIFTVLPIAPFPDDQVRRYLPTEIWTKLEARRFGSVVTLGVDSRVNKEIEALGNPVVTFGAFGSYQVSLAMLEACQLAVGELARVGATKIALYNTPFISVREVFMAAVSAHGAKEMFLPFDAGFDDVEKDQIVRHFHLAERGLRAARLALDQRIPEANRPDGIVSLDDMFTQGFIMGMINLGLVPGKDVKIVTYANANSSSLVGWEKDLIRIEFDPAGVTTALHSAADALEAGSDLGEMWGPKNYVSGDGFQRTCMVRGQLKSSHSKSVLKQ